MFFVHSSCEWARERSRRLPPHRGSCLRPIMVAARKIERFGGRGGEQDVALGRAVHAIVCSTCPAAIIDGAS